MNAPVDRSPQSLVSRLLEAYCKKHDLDLTLLDGRGHSGHVRTTSGRRWFFRGTHFDLNPLGSSEIADDKAASLTFLKEAGLPVPESQTLSGPTAEALATALDFADQHGFPVFLKPNEGQEGLDVERLVTRTELEDAVERLLARHRLLLLQEAIEGDDVRVLVLDGSILCAIQRIPPALVGDGKTQVRDLMERTHNRLLSDPRSARELQRQGFNFDTVPAVDQRIQLLPNANLSAGGFGTLVTHTLSSALADTAANAAERLNLRYAGIDLIARPDGSCRILEVNAAPGLARLASQGERENEVVAGIYERVFDALTFGPDQ